MKLWNVIIDIVEAVLLEDQTNTPRINVDNHNGVTQLTVSFLRNLYIRFESSTKYLGYLWITPLNNLSLARIFHHRGERRLKSRNLNLAVPPWHNDNPVEIIPYAIGMRNSSIELHPWITTRATRIHDATDSDCVSGTAIPGRIGEKETRKREKKKRCPAESVRKCSS